MVQPTIDTAIFDELKETAGAEFVGELVDTFLVEAPAMLRDLRSALAAGNADAFRRAAHSLKSNCNTFGALTLAAQAKELELTGLAAALAAKGATLDAVEQEYARVAAALTDLKNA
jgi:HPt (histidine-containing phosphotransfer) domain-containing protein